MKMGRGKHTELENVPIFNSYNDHIRPLLDAVDKLRLLKVTKEGIQLPTIVVVGDQSSGKSSVLESLAGISLPRGQGICTRVPLIMRLQHHTAPEAELSLEFKGNTISTDEAKVADAINLATDEVAGNGKGISNDPLTLVVKKQGISVIPVSFVEKVCHYVEVTMISVMKQRSQNYQQLQSLTTRAGHIIIEKMKKQFTSWVMELVEKEKMTDYTCSPENAKNYNDLISKQHMFIEGVQNMEQTSLEIEGLGVVALSHLRNHLHVLNQAFDLKMRMVAYWKIVLRRMVDSIALHLRYSLENLVNKEFEKEIFKELMVTHNGKVEKMLAESPSVAVKREKLKESIKLLKDSKEVLSDCMDKITLNSY